MSAFVRVVEPSSDVSRGIVMCLRSFGERMQAVAKLPQIAVVDWGNRAARALNVGERSGATCMSVVEGPRSIVVHTGVGVSGECSRFERVLTGLAASHESHRRADPTNGVSCASWQDCGLHPFRDAGMSPGLVVRGVAPMENGRSLVMTHWSSEDCASEADVASWGVVLEFEARSASRLWGSCEGAPRWLTLAETRVLNALMLGMTEGEAAAAIGRSVSTVHDHVKAIRRKTGVSTRGELVARMSGTRQDQREAWVAGVTPR